MMPAAPVQTYTAAPAPQISYEQAGAAYAAPPQQYAQTQMSYEQPAVAYAAAPQQFAVQQAYASPAPAAYAAQTQMSYEQPAVAYAAAPQHCSPTGVCFACTCCVRGAASNVVRAASGCLRSCTPAVGIRSVRGADTGVVRSTASGCILGGSPAICSSTG